MNERVEDIAHIIYDAFPYVPRNTADEKPAWIPWQNNIRQNCAREAARAILALLNLESYPDSAQIAYVRQLESLVQCLLDNDPEEPAADGGASVIDVWRQVATRLGMNKK